MDDPRILPVSPDWTSPSESSLITVTSSSDIVNRVFVFSPANVNNTRVINEFDSCQTRVCSNCCCRGSNGETGKLSRKIQFNELKVNVIGIINQTNRLRI